MAMSANNATYKINITITPNKLICGKSDKNIKPSPAESINVVAIKTGPTCFIVFSIAVLASYFFLYCLYWYKKWMLSSTAIPKAIVSAIIVVNCRPPSIKYNSAPPATMGKRLVLLEIYLTWTLCLSVNLGWKRINLWPTFTNIWQNKLFFLTLPKCYCIFPVFLKKTGF